TFVLYSFCHTVSVFFFFFFFSSRRRHTRFSRDWSSDVCSSDLPRWSRSRRTAARRRSKRAVRSTTLNLSPPLARSRRRPGRAARSEERRVGKECRTRGAA